MTDERIVYVVDGAAVIPDDGHSYKIAIRCVSCGKDIAYALTMYAGAFTDSKGGTWRCRACGTPNAVPSFLAGSQADIDAARGVDG